MKNLFLLVLATLAVACEGRRTPECTPTTTRCIDNLVQLCDADGRWFVVADCEQLGRMSGVGWSCAAVSATGDLEEHTCVPRRDADLPSSLER